jgi:hypothetical protein
LWRVAGAEGGPDGSERDAPAFGKGANLGERELEILVDVVAQRLEWRNVDDFGLVGERAEAGPPDQRVDTDRKAASVFPDPVGAEISTSRPSRMKGQPWIWGSVGAPRRVSNHSATRGSKEDSTAEALLPFYRVGAVLQFGGNTLYQRGLPSYGTG